MIRLFSLSLLILIGCRVRPAFHLEEVSDLDYRKLEFWASHPMKHDSADLVPTGSFANRQDEAEVDVFFLHPTTYTGQRGHRYWNARPLDARLMKKTDETTIRHQASIFNGVGKIYAPRYRQAHLHAYFTKNKRDANKAFRIAYHDVKTAFIHYMREWNQGRPIIIAAHSQGSTHAMQLMKEFFDGQALQENLVVAYLVGMPVSNQYFDHISICQSPEDYGCYCTWRTFKTGYNPKNRITGDTIGVTNPLHWHTSDQYAADSLNEGAVLRHYHRGITPKLTDARIHNGILWAQKPKFPGSFLMTFRNYHIADYNLYWSNVRTNAEQRWHTFKAQNAVRMSHKIPE